MRFDDPADVDLSKTIDDSASAAPRRPPSIVLVAVLGVLLLALAAGYLFLRRAPQPTLSTAAVTKPSTTVTEQSAEPAEQIPLPPLDETDPLVRELVGRLSSHPAVAAWLTTDGLLLNFVVVAANLARGETPAGELKAVRPAGSFRTRTAGEVLSIDPASYARYDRYGDAVAALDARGTARLYATLKPRLGDAYRRTGHLDTFDPILERAIVELLKVPVVERDVAVEPRGNGYAFADPRLERMSAAQKQLLRMGPKNVRTVQNKLREIAGFLGIPESRLPARFSL